MKQGVQLLLERVQRHRAFPRLAAANGQNLQTTLSPANIPIPLVSRLERPRFIPVIAEPLVASGLSLQNTDFDFSDEGNTGTSASLGFEASFLGEALINDATQVDEQFSEQTFDQTSALEPSQGIENVESVTSSGSLAIKNQVDAAPNQNAPTPNTNSSRDVQQTEIANDRPISQPTARQAFDTQTRASLINQAAQLTSSPTQPRATLPATVRSSSQDNSRLEIVQTEFATSTLSPALEQDISFSESNQSENTKSIMEQVSVSAINTFVESSNLAPAEITQTVDAPDESQSEFAIDAVAQVVRSPSRLESTLEALRQFNPQTQNNEPILASQPTAPNTRAAKTSSIAPSGVAKAQPKPALVQNPVEPNLATAQAQFENQKLPKPQLLSGVNPPVEVGNQNPSTIQTALEAQNPTAKLGAQTEFAQTQGAGIKSLQTKAIQTKAVQTEAFALEVLKTDLSSSATEQSGVEQTQISPSDRNQMEPQSELAPPQTDLLQTLQPETPSVTPAQTQLPQVNPIQPRVQTKTSSPETPDNQRPSENSQGASQVLTESSLSAAPTIQTLATQTPATQTPATQTPLSEEARERAAYQRSVTMRSERAKRALEAKEELERDPTLEINETPPTRSSEPQQPAASDLKLPLEPQPQIKVMPSIETGLENPQTQNPETNRSSQNTTPDLAVAVESNSSDQFANNVGAVKPIVTPSTTETLIESPTPNLGNLQASNLGELQTPNSSQVQSLNSDQTSADSSEVQTFYPSETQDLGLKQSLIEDLAKIQPDQSSSQVQNSNLAQIPNQTPDSDQTATQNSSQAVTPNQDVPASFLSNIQGVSVYNPQRRIQRAAPTPPPKPKSEPNEAEKLFADTPGMSQQDVLNVIRKAQGLPPVPITSQVQNPVQENIRTVQNTLATNNLNQETMRPTEQAIESNNPSLIKTSLSQSNQDARVEQIQEDFNVSNSSLNELQTTNVTPAQTRAVPTKDVSVATNTLDAQGNKIHVFNPPNRRVSIPKPKVEQPKTEAEKLFGSMEVTETADELFQRVVKNRLKPNTNLEPQEQDQPQPPDVDTAGSSLKASMPNTNQTLSPNPASVVNRNPLNPSDQAANTSFTGSQRVQLSQNATRFLKPIVGIDPNDVKIYRDPQSERLTKAVRADALTVGDTVLLSSEQPLESPETLGLIAHELTHVARNRQARFVPPVARGNNNLAANAQSGNEEGLALGVETLARQGWNGFNQSANQSIRSQSTSSNTETNRSGYGGLPAPADLPQWFIEDRTPPQATSQPAPRASNVAPSAPESSFIPQAPTNQMAAFMGAQAASQERDIPTPPPAAGPLPASQQPKPEPISNRAAPDLDAMARQVYTILKRRLANERHRM